MKLSPDSIFHHIISSLLDTVVTETILIADYVKQALRYSHVQITTNVLLQSPLQYVDER